MSVSIYDTAWLSMVKKPNDDEQWLFPECFDYILRNQQEDGNWPSYASTLDGILNTAAALLAVRKHLSRSSEKGHLQEISWKAEVALAELIRSWDVLSCDQVGFEIIFTTHIGLLEEEGVVLQVPQLEQLKALREAKLSRLPASLVYKGPSAVYHSLEGLIGHIDFDKISRWRESNGSMMGSPSSTAAYLIHSSKWDDLAEAYLRDVVANGSGKGSGAVPSAWPSSIFELSWAITTLVESGILIGEAEASSIRNFLEASLQMQKGIVGFAPGSLADADDTARSLITLFYLNRNTEPYIEALIGTFETAEHFQTYLAERNPSLSTNINVLSCLLLTDDPLLYVPQITKAASFICRTIFAGDVKEKWHIHQLYWMMLLSKAMVLTYKRMQGNEALCKCLLVAAPHLKEQIPIILYQILTTVLKLQNRHGNWEGNCELTAYAILTLSSLAQVTLTGAELREQINESINQGKLFLIKRRDQWRNGAYLWTEKVTYSSSILSEVYSLAAVVDYMTPPTTITIPLPFQVSERVLKGMSRAGHLISRTPLFNQANIELLFAAQLQACYALTSLQPRRLDIFPRTGMGEDKYLTFIPLTWTACMSLQQDPVSLAVLFDMMLLSMLNYQVDEYMEDMLEHEGQQKADFASAQDTVRQLFNEVAPSKDEQNGTSRTRDMSQWTTELKLPECNGKDLPKANGHTNGSHAGISSMKSVLRRYSAHILQHPSVIKCPRNMQAQLARELQTFLLAHINHAEDNYALSRQPNGIPSNCPHLHNGDSHNAHNGLHNGVGGDTKPPNYYLKQYENPGRTFHNWVHSTSADHTSCPFSFVFFQCLLFPIHGDVAGRSAKTAYLVEDACRHLASLCRMYNDYGSLARDTDESNLNSLNFPEFAGFAKNEEQQAKAQLMNIAEYERRCLDVALSELENEILGGNGGSKGKWMGAIKLFVNVTDLYGQIYVVKDIATRK
ncbi:hypothetical protein K445DRAFT_310851 [Daldinia sp. EC12]|nr:hypothetical protein K445DRAFT_310851 [Daldinia sp. EC12]